MSLTTSLTVAAIALVLASLAGVLWWHFRVGLKAALRQPLAFTRAHMLLGGALLGALFAFNVWTDMRARQAHDRERDARLEARVLDRREVAGIARRVSEPTTAEFASLLARFNRQCQPDPRCRALYAKSVNRVLRVTNSRIVPAPGDAPVRPRSTPGRFPPPPPVTPPPPPMLPPPSRPAPVRPDPRVGRLINDVRELREVVANLERRPQLDSILVDTLDDRLTDLELLGQQLRAGLCSPALTARLLTGLGVCR